MTKSDQSALDADLFELLTRWRAAEEEGGHLFDECYDIEDARAPTPMPPEMLRRDEDSTLFMPERAVVGATYNAEWIASYAIIVDRARSSQRPFARALVARFDEILRTFGEWLAAEEASRAAVRLPELIRARDDAQQKARDLRRRVAETRAQTVDGMLAKLAAFVRVRDTETIDDELDMALAEPFLDVDDVFLSVARDCSRLPELAALAPPSAPSQRRGGA